MQRSFVRALLAPLAGVLLAASPAVAKLDEKTWTQAKRDLEQALAGTEAEAVVKAIETIGGNGTRRRSARPRGARGTRGRTIAAWGGPPVSLSDSGITTPRL